MKLKNNQKGITLIALVITIIILLILAGVTISTLTESGLFEKTKEAKNKTQEAENTENEILKDYINKIDDYINDKSKIKDYIITFNANDGVIIDDDGNTSTESTKTVTFGSTYGELPIPTKEGYTFLGWFTADNKQILNTSILNIEENHTLYAQWAANKYTVTFDSNGGIFTSDDGTTFTLTTKEVTYDSAYGELPTPTREGYSFLGWYTETTDGEQILPETTVSSSENITIYAKWAEIVTTYGKYTFYGTGTASAKTIVVDWAKKVTSIRINAGSVYGYDSTGKATCDYTIDGNVITFWCTYMEGNVRANAYVYITGYEL